MKNQVVYKQSLQWLLPYPKAYDTSCSSAKWNDCALLNHFKGAEVMKVRKITKVMSTFLSGSSLRKVEAAQSS